MTDRDGRDTLTGASGLTGANGAPIPDEQNAMTAGPRGPVLLQDTHLIEKTARFNRERIPERVVHAKGAGAFGTFRVTNDISGYTKASLFQGIGTETPVLARFSTEIGERGAADAERDVRGFAIKFYTDDGNWDLVASNMPVFFVRDPLKFPDFVHARRRHPRSNLRDAAMQWDFLSRSPESLHATTVMMSDRGRPASYRHMNGYGGHAYSLLNADNERFWVKFHLKTQQGVRTLSDVEAGHVIARDPDSHARDLFEAIGRGEAPTWTLYVQVMPERDAGATWYNPFDVTKVWPHADYPLIEVGELTLDRNPNNHFAEVEQASFQPGALVPGIGVSPDKMLQARLFAYADAQRYRLGVNHGAIPVNRPRVPAADGPGRDGAMRIDDNAGAAVAPVPGSAGRPGADPRATEPPLRVDGDADRYDDRQGNDDHRQAGDLFRRLTPEAQTRLIDAIAQAMTGVPAEIQRRQIGHFYQADPAYGAGVARGLGIDIAEAAE
jgi:catalase